MLDALPRRIGRIGAELGREMALRMPVSSFCRSAIACTGVELVNGSPCIWDIRMIKTEAEIAHISLYLPDRQRRLCGAA